MLKQQTDPSCPLCSHRPGDRLHRDRWREYFRCAVCDLIFVPERYHLPPAEEKARYDFHRNDPADKHYRAFLARLAEPLQKKLRPGACGLDFGCGAEPTLSAMLAEAGFPCADYDRYYACDPAVLEEQYDFLTCSETIEHFYRPREEFERFLRLVRPGGWIGIMTQMHDAAASFAGWHYKDDPTHVCFFSRRTFETLAEIYGLRIEFHPGSVTLVQTGAERCALSCAK